MEAREILDFGRHNESAVRLYLQHWMSKQHLGFLLHPSILRETHENLKLMDVACGTGIWLVDVAALLPKSAQLDGFDISSAHFPPKHELPANVNMSTHDVLQPFPEELHGQYDIVHVGRINLTVRGNDPGPVLKNVVQLLKPGGYLQWDDLDVGGIHSVKSDNTFNTPHCDKLLDFSGKFFTKLGCGSEWPDKLPHHFQLHGMTPIESRRVKVTPGYARPWTAMQMMANHDFVEHDIIPGTAGRPDMPTADEWREMVTGVDRECGLGLRILQDFFYTIGRKDSSN